MSSDDGAGWGTAFAILAGSALAGAAVAAAVDEYDPELEALRRETRRLERENDRRAQRLADQVRDECRRREDELRLRLARNAAQRELDRIERLPMPRMMTASQAALALENLPRFDRAVQARKWLDDGKIIDPWNGGEILEKVPSYDRYQVRKALARAC